MERNRRSGSEKEVRHGDFPPRRLESSSRRLHYRQLCRIFSTFLFRKSRQSATGGLWNHQKRHFPEYRHRRQHYHHCWHSTPVPFRSAIPFSELPSRISRNIFISSPATISPWNIFTIVCEVKSVLVSDFFDRKRVLPGGRRVWSQNRECYGTMTTDQTETER